jgi:hypothetical protein
VHSGVGQKPPGFDSKLKNGSLDFNDQKNLYLVCLVALQETLLTCATVANLFGQEPLYALVPKGLERGRTSETKYNRERLR